MTTTSSISTISNTAATSTLSNSSSSSASSALSFDTNEWLTLLTTQLQYQDPMSPADPTQFVAELAQFSSVSQQVTTNTTLNTISSQLSSSSLGMAASMIGKTVQGPASSYTVPSTGSASSVSYTYSVTDSDLSNLYLQVTNSSGSVVSQSAISGTTGTVTFDGTSSSGSALAAGTYTVALVGTDSSGNSQTAGTLTAGGTVSQVLQNDGTTQLLLSNGSVLDAASVTSLADGS